MKVLLRFVVPILSFISMAACPVKADTFHFSFTNSTNGGGTVTGTIILNATDTAATSLTVDTNSATPTFGIGQYVGSPFPNSFTVVSGQITVANFLDFGSDNSSPAITCCSLNLILSGPTVQAGLSNDPFGVNGGGAETSPSLP